MKKKVSPINLPNALSLLRMILVPFFVFFVLWLEPATPAGALIPAAIFALTSLTDCLDGQIARRCHMITSLGKFLDPLADKFMIFSALLVLAYRYNGALFPYMGNWLIWTAVIVMFRDLAVTTLRLVAAGQNGTVIAASIWGKAKTVSHIIGVLVIMLEPLLWEVPYLKDHFYQNHITPISHLMMAVMIITSLFSGWEYLKTYFPLLSGHPAAQTPDAEEGALRLTREKLAAMPPVAHSDALKFRDRIAEDYWKTGNAIRIVIVGDSVSHGCFAPPEDYDYDAVYHNRLRLMIQRVYPNTPVNIINEAVGGVSADWAEKHFDTIVAPQRPDLVIVAFGLNDLGSTPEEFGRRLGVIFDKSHEIGADCVFMTENMLNTYSDEPRTEPRFLDYSRVTADLQNAGKMDIHVEAARKTANEHGVPVADAYAIWRELYDNGVDTTKLLINGINHPTRAMHRVFAEVLYHCLFGTVCPEEAAVKANSGMAADATR